MPVKTPLEKILAKLEKFSESGWRRVFFWASVIIVIIALSTAYVYLPCSGRYPPIDYLGKLNDTTMLVLSLSGLRGIEKFMHARIGEPNVAA